MKAMLNVKARAMLLTMTALCLLAVSVHAQSDPAKTAPATVTGRVMDGKRPLAGVSVRLYPNGPGMRFEGLPSAKTDAEGRYRLSGVAPGAYRVVTIAPAHVPTGAGDEAMMGRALTINPGETIEGVDFHLARGGVITGRVTDSGNRPVIGEMVQITPEDNSQPGMRVIFSRADQSMMLTDDRGVYRVYGLAAGRYRVSVGTGARRGMMGRPISSSDGTQTFYQRTFYPGVTDQAQAKIVEVSAGQETADIDITVEKTTRQTYSVAGRLVFAETGQPAANIGVDYWPARGGDGRGGPFVGANVRFGPGGIVSDARGEFKLDGLAAGRYTLSAISQGSADWYSEQVSFEVADADVEGLEVKLKRGASVSGSIVIEGLSDRATVARLLSRARLIGRNETADGAAAVQNFSPAQTVAADGSFRFGGLRAGKLQINIGYGTNQTGELLTLLRVEQGGVVAARNSVEVADGAQVTGVRVVAAYGNGVVRGHINIVGGALPDGWRLMVNARRLGSGDGQFIGRGVEADSRGYFIVNGLAPGEYEFQAMAMPMNGPGGPRAGGGGGANGRRLMGVAQRATINDSGEQILTLVLNMNSGGGNQ